MSLESDELDLLLQVVDIYDQSFVANSLSESDKDSITRETINRWIKGKSAPGITVSQFRKLESLLPQPPKSVHSDFRFVEPVRGYRWVT